MEFLENTSDNEFLMLSADNQIRFIIRLSEKSQVDFADFKVFQLTILADTDRDVKFAALKRIHLFKGQPELLPMMNKLRQQESSKDLEPYFSMALSRLGIISLDEF